MPSASPRNNDTASLIPLSAIVVRSGSFSFRIFPPSSTIVSRISDFEDPPASFSDSNAFVNPPTDSSICDEVKAIMPAAAPATTVSVIPSESARLKRAILGEESNPFSKNFTGAFKKSATSTPKKTGYNAARNLSRTVFVTSRFSETNTSVTIKTIASAFFMWIVSRYTRRLYRADSLKRRPINNKSKI